MPNINALIATAGGYQAPNWDYLARERNITGLDTQNLLNQRARMDLAQEPERIKREERLGKLQELVAQLDIATKAAGPVVEQPFDWEGVSYILKGRGQDVSEMLSALKKDVTSLSRGDIQAWMAQKQISLQRVEPKAPVAGTQAALDWEEAKARVGAKYRAPESQGTPNSYHPPLITSQGIFPWDPKSNSFSKEPMKGPDNNVLLPTAADPSLKGSITVSQEQMKKLVEERKDVEGAVQSLANINEAKKLLDSGIITGTGAQFLTNMGSLLSSRFGFKAAEDPVANTQAFAATMGNQVGQIIKQFGSGTGLSDADREYAEKIVGGRITLNEQAIRKLIDINEKAFNNVITRYNEKADQATKNLKVNAMPYDLRVGPSKASGLGTVPQKGDVQDGYRFIGGDPGDSKNWEKVE